LLSCIAALLLATASCEDVKKETEQIQGESSNIEKRGLHGSFGGHDWSGSSSYGGGSDHGHHEHIKTITIEKKYPVPYEVVKKIPYSVEKKIPYEVKVSIPQPYEVIKKYPVKVKEVQKYTVEVPKPYEVIKKVPYEVKVPVDRPYNVKGNGD